MREVVGCYEKKRKACGEGKPGSKKRKEKLAGKENQRHQAARKEKSENK